MTSTEGPVRYTEQDRQAGCPLVHTVCAADLACRWLHRGRRLEQGNLSQEHQYCEEEDVSQEMSGRLTSKDNVLFEQQVWASESQQLLLKKSSCGGPREARLKGLCLAKSREYGFSIRCG